MAGNAKRNILIEILGDAKNYSRATKEAEGATQRFQDRVEAAGRALALAYGAKKVVDFGIQAVKAAAEDAAAQQVLGKALKNTTGATDDQIASIEKWITQTQNATGILDDQLRPALGTLVRATRNVTEAQELMNLALDVSRGTGKDVETVAGALAKAYGGNTTALTRLIPGIKQAGDDTLTFSVAQQRLNEQFKGQAATYADTAAGRLERLNAQYQDMKETIGTALMPAVTMLVGGISDVFDWFNSLAPAQQQIIVGAGLLVGALYVGVTAFNALSVAVSTLGLTMDVAMPWLAAATAAVAVLIGVVGVFADDTAETKKRQDEFNKSVRQAATGIDIQTIAFLDATQAAKAYREAVFKNADQATRDKVAGDMRMVDAMNQFGYSMDDVINATHSAAAAQEFLNKTHTTEYVKAYNQATQDEIDGMNALLEVLFATGDAAEGTIAQNVELAKTGDIIAITFLKASGNLDLLSTAEQKAAEAALDHAATQTDELKPAVEDTTDALDEQRQKIEDLYNATRSQIDSQFNLRDAQRGTLTAFQDLNTVYGDSEATLFDVADAQDKAQQAALRQADAAVRLAEDQAKATGATLDAEDKARIWSDTLNGIAGTLDPASPLRAELNQFADDIRNFPNGKTISFDVKVYGDRGSGLVLRGARELGGPIEEGEAYVVGEKRAEILIGPKGGGHILPDASKARRAVSGGKPSTGQRAVPAITNYITVADRATAQDIVRESVWSWRLVGASG